MATLSRACRPKELRGVGELGAARGGRSADGVVLAEAAAKHRHRASMPRASTSSAKPSAGRRGGEEKADGALHLAGISIDSLTFVSVLGAIETKSPGRHRRLPLSLYRLVRLLSVHLLPLFCSLLTQRVTGHSYTSVKQVNATPQ